MDAGFGLLEKPNSAMAASTLAREINASMPIGLRGLSHMENFLAFKSSTVVTRQPV